MRTSSNDATCAIVGRDVLGLLRRVRVDVLVAGELADLVHHLVGELAQREVLLLAVAVARRVDRLAEADRHPAEQPRHPLVDRLHLVGADQPDRHDRRRRCAARAARRRCARGAGSRRGCACLRDRCRTRRRRRSTSVADASARSLALPPSRRIGIWPTPRKNHAVFGSSKYSALATNVTRRRRTSGMKIESRNERWFEARITGPRFGHVLAALDLHAEAHAQDRGERRPSPPSTASARRAYAARAYAGTAIGSGRGRLRRRVRGRSARARPAARRRAGAPARRSRRASRSCSAASRGGVVERPLRAEVVPQGTSRTGRVWFASGPPSAFGEIP